MVGKSNRVVVLLFLWVFCLDATAQGRFNIYENTIERISKARDVAPLSVDTLFGDQISHYDGSVSFSHVDISMPGNDALPVELRRILRVEDRSRGSGHFLGGFGEWELDLPSLSSEVATNIGWRSSGGTVNQRCSVPAPLADVGTISAEDYWGGYDLYIPGNSKQQLLMDPNGMIPSATGGPYPWITKDMWRIACKSSSKNGYAGEAFLALSPQGMKYHLDWAVTRPHAGVDTKPLGGGVDRQVVYFLVSRIEDRFGNWIDYTYSGDKLTSITASDGRQITLTWSGSNVSSATSNVGSWAYSYAGGKLSQVTRADGSKWTFTSAGSLGITPAMWSPPYENPAGCPDALEPSSGSYMLSITAPSGATGQFTFEVLQHMRSNIPENACTIVSSTYWYMKVPRFHWSLSLISRTIAGPGLPGMTWNYTYGWPDLLFNPNVKKNTVTGPDSTWVRYSYGTGFNLNEGQLLAVEEGSSAASILQTRTDTYVTTAEAASQHFPSAVGYNPRRWSDRLATEWLRPLQKTVSTRQGTSFTRQIPETCSGKYCFDVFARPTAAVQSSTLSGSP